MGRLLEDIRRSLAVRVDLVPIGQVPYLPEVHWYEVCGWGRELSSAPSQVTDHGSWNQRLSY